MHSLSALQQWLTEAMASKSFGKEPVGLYEPFHYILDLGGKRLRPTLVLLGCEAFGADAKKALEAAMAIELFHNFSLVHDDIMDDAPLRRGKPTVHEEWNVNTAILTGDSILVQAYRQLESVPDNLLRPVFQIFNRTAREVCEGQQMDMDFEERNDVSEAEYIRMIQFKTSVLLGAALQIGALLGGADERAGALCYQFALNLGTAFQIKDDLLDAFGDPGVIGKQAGGDILANKKTILLIHALEKSGRSDRKTLLSWLEPIEHRPEEKIEAVREIYRNTGSETYAEQRMEAYYQMARKALEALREHGANTDELERFAVEIYERKY